MRPLVRPWLRPSCCTVPSNQYVRFGRHAVSRWRTSRSACTSSGPRRWPSRSGRSPRYAAVEQRCSPPERSSLHCSPKPAFGGDHPDGIAEIIAAGVGVLAAGALLIFVVLLLIPRELGFSVNARATYEALWDQQILEQPLVDLALADAFDERQERECRRGVAAGIASRLGARGADTGDSWSCDRRRASLVDVSSSEHTPRPPAARASLRRPELFPAFRRRSSTLRRGAARPTGTRAPPRASSARAGSPTGGARRADTTRPSGGDRGHQRAVSSGAVKGPKPVGNRRCRLLGGELRELLGGGGVALVRKAAQLVHIAQLGNWAPDQTTCKTR